MKSSSKYNNNFSEYEKAIQFLKEGCKCGCSKKVPPEKFAKVREGFQNLSKAEQDIFLMAQLITMDGGEETASSRFPKKERQNQRTFYCWNRNIPFCQETYLNMLGIGQFYLERMRNHLFSDGLVLEPKPHGNTDRTPWRKTKMFIDKTVKKELKTFLLNYAEKYGLPDPGRIKRITQSVIYLPTEKSYSSVYRNFLASRAENDKLKQLKYDVFRRLWHELTPNIKFMKPKTDLCDTCHKLKNEIHSCKEANEREELKKIWPASRKKRSTKRLL